MIRFMLPAIAFAVLVGFLYMGLSLNPREVPSPFIGKQAPAFSLPVLGDNEKTLSPEDMKGQVWMLNVWATWCPGCRQEHDALLRLQQRNIAPIVGFDYKDEPEKAEVWLRELGNPYQIVVEDKDGRAAIDWGVYGAPETFIIDAKGIVRYKHIGPLSDADVAQDLVPVLQKLKAEASL
ncbi:MAG: DsbE family thiol:disulfide interchange protein [Granulosicoccaceae bacterium]